MTLLGAAPTPVAEATSSDSAMRQFLHGLPGVDMVETAVHALSGSGVRVASVATAFPSGRAALDVKLADTKQAVAAGADEIDMVIDRGPSCRGVT